MTENHDLAGQHPEIVKELEASLGQWASQLQPADIPTGTGNPQEQKFYQHFFQVPKP